VIKCADQAAADRARSSHAMTVRMRERQLITAVHARADERASDQGQDGVPMAVFNLGALYGRLGEPARAEALYERVAATADDAALAELVQLSEGWGTHTRAAGFRNHTIND
jgi:hypothetical protein